MVSPERTTWMTVAVVLAGRACVGADVADLVGVDDGRPGTSSFCPGWITDPPAVSRFFSTIARMVVRWARARCQSVSPGRTVTVVHGVAVTGATAACAGSA